MHARRQILGVDCSREHADTYFSSALFIKRSKATEISVDLTEIPVKMMKNQKCSALKVSFRVDVKKNEKSVLGSLY